MRILEKLSALFGLNADPRPAIISPNVDLGYLKRINYDGSIGGFVHSTAVIPANVFVEPRSQVDPYVHIESGRVRSGTLVTIQNNQIVEIPLP